MSNFEFTSINDRVGTEVKVGGQSIVQGPDTIFHPTAVPMSSVIQEATGVTLSTSPTNIALDGTENFVMLDFGTNDPAGAVRFSLQYTTGGDLYAAPFFTAQPFDLMPGLMGHVTAWATSGYSEVQLDENTARLDGSRVVYVPTMGAKVLRVVTQAGTLAGTAWRRLMMQAPITHSVVRPIRSFGEYLLSTDITITNTTVYAAGNSIGGTVTMRSRSTPRHQNAAPILRSIRLADNGGAKLGDFDVIVMPAASNSDLADNAALSLDYPAGVLAWFEVRAAPTSTQVPRRDFGSAGGRGCIISDLNIPIPYVVPRSTPADTYVEIADVVVVDRTGITGAGETVSIEGSVEW